MAEPVEMQVVVAHQEAVVAVVQQQSSQSMTTLLSLQAVAVVAAAEVDLAHNHGAAHTLQMEAILPVQMVYTVVIAAIPMVVVPAAVVAAGTAVRQEQSIDQVAAANVVHSLVLLVEISSATQRHQQAMGMSPPMAPAKAPTILFTQQQHHAQLTNRPQISTQLSR
jgi:hypothetical protein